MCIHHSEDLDTHCHTIIRSAKGHIDLAFPLPFVLLCSAAPRSSQRGFASVTLCEPRTILLVLILFNISLLPEQAAAKGIGWHHKPE